ncbi:hypothetical protein NDU88_009314 [Pleurodeles waltl]|uniref:Uncharacterized protein n=1 Tax=Pleurodeles waltl TaxID=8319 RepID=A0AAV7RY58_PLEWA|nr:hypothetical protein NDU88_009314 [Pleurodeles waltl]
MCRPAAEITETRSAQQRGEAPGGRPRHWERAALELRPVRRGSARIPLWGIQAEPAQARFLGGSPRSLVARQRALFRQPGRQLRLLGLLDAHPGRAEGAGAPPFFF